MSDTVIQSLIITVPLVITNTLVGIAGILTVYFTAKNNRVAAQLASNIALKQGSEIHTAVNSNYTALRDDLKVSLSKVDSLLTEITGVRKELAESKIENERLKGKK